MKFVADGTVSRLGRWLALAGCDVVCDARSARALLRDPAVLRSVWTVLGRSPSLAAEDLAPGLFLGIRSERLAEQLTEVARAYPEAFRCAQGGGAAAQALAGGLAVPATEGKGAHAVAEHGVVPFSRCSRCNEALEGPLTLEALGADAASVPERVRRWRGEFRRCPRCRRVYWEGTHTQRIRAALARAVEAAAVRRA